MFNDDGSYESSNLPDATRLKADRDFSLFKAMVTRAIFVDDKENISKDAADSSQEVIYEVIIVGGPKSGQVLTNVRDASFLGGENNYSEKMWKASSQPNFSRQGGKSLSQQDGDLVFVQFLGGNPLYPVIIGAAPHYKSKGKVGTKKADAPRLLFEYNGLNVLINNKGELLVTRKGGKVDSTNQSFTPEENGEEAKIQLLENKVIIIDKNENKIEIDAETKKITINAVEQFELSTKVLKLLAENSFTLESPTINISGTTIIISGSQVLLGGGGPGVARVGDRAIGAGNHGRPVISTIIQGSSIVKAG